VNHFEWIEYHPNFDDWAPGPVQAMPDESDDESTFSANGDPVPNDDDSIPFRGQDFDPDIMQVPNGVRLIPDQDAAGDPEDNLQAQSDVATPNARSDGTVLDNNQSVAHAVVDDAQVDHDDIKPVAVENIQVVDEDTKPAARPTRNEVPPMTPSAMANTPPLAKTPVGDTQQANFVTTPFSIEERVVNKPNASRFLEVYKNPINTPMKEDITKRDLAIANPFFIKQADNLIHFRSEGSYDVPLSRFEFYSLMDVTSSSDGLVQYLKWRLYPNLSANEARDAAAKKKKAVTGLYLSQMLQKNHL
jgi:hypothetical protein